MVTHAIYYSNDFVGFPAPCPRPFQSTFNSGCMIILNKLQVWHCCALAFTFICAKPYSMAEHVSHTKGWPLSTCPSQNCRICIPTLPDSLNTNHIAQSLFSTLLMLPARPGMPNSGTLSCHLPVFWLFFRNQITF